METTIQINWKVDWDKNTIDPQDGEAPIKFWWDDMGPAEIMMLVQTVYERGCRQKSNHRTTDGGEFYTEHGWRF